MAFGMGQHPASKLEHSLRFKVLSDELRQPKIHLDLD